MSALLRAGLAALLVAAPTFAQEVKVLFLTHSAGFTHAVVKRMMRGRIALAEHELVKAARDQFLVVPTQDCSVLDAERLKEYRCVVFYTTGELPVSEAGKQALIDYVKGGGGFVGVHSATDTFYRFPAYGEMIGGYFNGHPWHQKVRVLVEDPTHPAMMRLGKAFEITDEIYQFKSFSRERVHVLARLDPESVDVERGAREDGDYALAWCRDYGKGRVFYTALGHRPQVWRDPRFLDHLVAGIRWAMNAEDELGRPPQDAVRLLDGSGLDAMVHRDGSKARWKLLEDGAVEVVPGTGDLLSKERFSDLRLHLEFAVPNAEDDAHGGNSGLYLQGRYEIQILRSFGKPPTKGSCGAIYGVKPPDVNASKEPGAWQSYDVWLRAARFDEQGRKTEPARVTVLHNGVKIHVDVPIPSKTGAGMAEGPEPGPILLQDHGSKVRFRNLWVVRR